MNNLYDKIVQKEGVFFKAHKEVDLSVWHLIADALPGPDFLHQTQPFETSWFNLRRVFEEGIEK